MAAALLAQRSAGAVEVASAGTQPGDHVQDEVVTVLAEVGVSTSELFPKPLTDEVVSGADVVVTMGCGDSCPVLPGRRYVDWDVADPAGADLDLVRRVRDDIDAHISALLAELLPDRGVTTASGQV
jgi:arsenate reductase